MDKGNLHAVVAERLAEVSQRYTKGRRALVEVLAGAARPVTIPEIVRTKRSLPQSSVYRNLATLEEARAVRRLPGAGGFARYELAEALTEHHHHLVCTSCGDVVDYTLPARLEKTLQRAERDIADSTGFVADLHQLDFHGVCEPCSAGDR
jgi:Fur family ferric uptake transcriptional regulator